MTKKAKQDAGTTENQAAGKTRAAFWVGAAAVVIAAAAGSVLFLFGNRVEDHELELKTSSLGEVVTYQFEQRVHYYISGKHMALCTDDGLLQVYPLECGRFELFCVIPGRKTQVWHGVLACEFEDNLIIPQPDNSDALAKKVAELMQKVPQEYRKVIPELAENYRKAAKLGLTDEGEILQAVMFKNRKTLGFDDPAVDPKFEAAWQTVLGAGGTLSQLLEKEFPEGIREWTPVLNSIAKGLETVK